MNNVDYFTVDNSDSRYFKEFKKTFPKTEFFTITFKKEEIFEQSTLVLIKTLTAQLMKFPEILDVRSLANVDYTVGENDAFTVRRFLQTIPSDKQKLQKLKAEALSEELYVPNLISKDGKTVSIVVFIKEKNEDDAYRRDLLVKVDALLAPHKSEVDYFYKAGWTVTNLALSSILQRDLRIFLPLTYVFIAISIYILFRNFSLVFLAVINLTACLISIFGLFGLTGITVNNLTAIALPLGLTLCLADTIHIFSYLDKSVLSKHKSHRDALSYILGYVLKPCFFTSLTTAIGFASLAMSSIDAMKDFAAIASLAMIFEFFYSFYLLPALIALMDPQKTFSSFDSDEDAGFNRLLNRWFDFLLKSYRVVVAVMLSLAVLGGYYLLKVPVETNVIKFFKQSNPLIQDLKFVEANVGGVASFDISLTSAKQDAFKEPIAIKYIDKLAQYLKGIQGIDSVTSLPDFFKEMNQSFHNEDPAYYTIPDSINQIEQYLLLYDGKDLENVANNSFTHSKIAVRMSIHSTREQKILLKTVSDFIDANPPPEGITARETGYAVNYTNVADEMVDGQISSFGTAVLVIGLMMIYLLRSVKLGLLSLVPNVYPILLTFGVMGFTGIALDTGTVMIASVALGIACDDTVHFLYVYGEKLRQGLPALDALRYVVVHKGRAIISTAIILTLGFAVLIFGQFIPVINFGILCTVTMVVAIGGDLLLLPALIIAKHKFQKEA